MQTVIVNSTTLSQVTSYTQSCRQVLHDIVQKFTRVITQGLNTREHFTLGQSLYLTFLPSLDMHFYYYGRIGQRSSVNVCFS